MNLEQRAEEMSQGGSDIGEEIRKMNEESKERSRQNSIQSSHQGDVNGVRGGGGGPLTRVDTSRSRASSHAHSAVGVNGAARWGGYSPEGYISSPVGSVHSSSWSHASMPRKASHSGSSRLAQMIEPVQEGRPLDSPLAPSSASYFDQQPSRQASQSSFSRQPSQSSYSQQPSQSSFSRQPSQSSFGRRYDHIASQIEESLEDVPPVPPMHTEPPPQDEREGHVEAGPSGTTTPPDRPRSTDTYQEAQIAFKDFDGVHFSPETEELVAVDEDGNEVRRVSARNSSGVLSMDAASLLRTPRARPISYAEPPPADGMIYYPAPVPRMLNLPKRLSQLPAVSVQAKRRTQMLDQLPQAAKQSAPWLPQMDLEDPASSSRSHRSHDSGSQRSEHPRPVFNERMGVRNLQNMPPQLRASIFFDHQSLQQDVDIKSESAVATLDNILAASASAPAVGFNDMNVRSSVYLPTYATARRSTTTLATAAPTDVESSTKKGKKRRSSTFGNLLRRSSSGDLVSEQLERTPSRNSQLLDFNEGGNKLQKRKSQISLGDGLEKRKSQMSLAGDLDKRKSLISLAGQPARTPGKEISEPDLAGGFIAQAQNADGAEDETAERRVASGSRPGTAHSGRVLNESQQIAEDFKEEEAQEDVEEGEPIYAQPTTLLAELQVRKANLRSRNRNAVTAFPNGMHSTLLELDAVEQINQKKRQRRHVPLAWEDPNQNLDEEDPEENVPLGVLFPGKGGMVPGKRKVGDGKDWDRPLGLMEKRELEDNEPLRSRANRLHGLPPDHGRVVRLEKRPGLLPSGSEMHLAGQPDAPTEQKAQEEAQDEEENEGETLAQRLRRLRTKDALDTAISDVAPKPGSRPVSTFTDDVLSQLGGLDVKEKPGSRGKDAVTVETPAAAGAEAEEETLGQRRARLQREREASGEQRPPLKSSNSLANILSANPIGSRQASKEHQAAQGTLLHASAQKQAKNKAQLSGMYMRASSYGMEKPLVDARPQTARVPSTMGLLGQQAAGMAANGGFAGGKFNNGLGGIGAAQQPLQTSVSTPYGMTAANSYFAQPTANMTFGGRYGGQQSMMGFAGMQRPQQAPMMNPLAYQALGGGGAPMAGYGYPAAYGGMGSIPGMPGMMQVDAPLDNKQRDAIDRWRMSVAQ